MNRLIPGTHILLRRCRGTLNALPTVLAVAVVGAFVALAPSPAKALAITTGCASSSTCTLKELFDGGTMQVNDKLFSNWNSLGNVNDAVDPTLVFVQGLSDQLFNPGLMYFSQDQWSVTATTTALVVARNIWEFDVTVLDPTLRMTDAFVGISRALCAEALTGFMRQCGIRVAVDLIDVPGGMFNRLVANQDLFLDTSVFDPRSSVHVKTDVQVTAMGLLLPSPFCPPFCTGVLQGQSILTTFIQRFSQSPTDPGPGGDPPGGGTTVPEPGTLMLVGFGLAGLGLMRRRRRNG